MKLTTPLVFFKISTDAGILAHSSTKLGTQMRMSLFVASTPASIVSGAGTRAGDWGLKVVRMFPQQAWPTVSIGICRMYEFTYHEACLENTHGVEDRQGVASESHAGQVLLPMVCKGDELAELLETHSRATYMVLCRS